MPNEKNRCPWADNDPIYRQYHDTEWGVPLHQDKRLFEFLILEGAQAGLSWITVLKKRPHYRKVFDRFDPKKVIHYGSRKIKYLLSDPGIIRNRLKIESTITNAKAFLKVKEEFRTFDQYIWQFVSHKPMVRHWEKMAHVPALTPESDAMSMDLKKRGFRFVGSTICYAFMQATGMVNDHLVSCFRHRQLIKGESR